MKNLNMIIRMSADDEYKLDFLTKKLNINKSNLIRILINMCFHDHDPPFREFSS